MFGFDFVISLFHLRLYPLRERVAYDRVNHVGDVLARQLVHLFFDRKIFIDPRVLFGESLHVLDGQALELRDIDVLDIG